MCFVLQENVVYRKILGYFKPKFTLGLTATPERTDGEDLPELFKNVAHKLDLKTAVEMGELAPIRCIRIKTNINLSTVRISGIKYYFQDLESKLFVPERNKIIYAVKGYSSLLVIFLVCIVSGIIEPITTGYLHHWIDSSMRATIDSFQSLGLRATIIIAGLGFGFFSSRFDIFGGYGFISFICGVFLVYFLISSKDVIE